MPRSRKLASLLVAAAAALVTASCGGEEPAATCDGGCALPPSPICDGDTRISFTPGGECVDGICQFPPILTDCSADGGSCEAGACVGPPPDPCDDVDCDAADIAPVCDGDVVVRPLTPGTCDSSDGTCSYEEDRIDCASFGEICDDGECRRPGNPCIGVVCDEPPSNGCDGDIALRYDGTDGTCDPETLDCVYAADEIDCAAEGAVCFRGSCIVPDPCDGVVCDSPPEDTCAGGELTDYPGAGRCVDGVCQYTPVVAPCGEGLLCSGGACVEPDPCDGVVCNRPPPNVCDGETLVIYAGRGECTSGFCTYSSSSRDCTDDGLICDEGVCFDAGPCHDVTCLDAPEPACDGDVAVEYSSPGECTAGLCNYGETRTNCAATDGRCIDGECIDACTGVVCGERRDPECVDEVTLLRRIGASECVAGECQFPTTIETDCDRFGAVCREGECIVPDPCEGVVCPAGDVCRGDFVVQRDEPGICDEGECDYRGVETLLNCADDGEICIEGECVPPGVSLGPDDIVFVEFMPLPTSELVSDQWLEIHNRTGTRLNMTGISIANAEGDSFLVGEGVVLEPFSSLGIGAREGISPEMTVTWGDGAFALGAAGDSLVIRYEDTVISRLTYDAATWPYGVGVSAQMSAGALDGGVPGAISNWCVGTFPYGDENVGSPGFRNAFCPFE